MMCYCIENDVDKSKVKKHNQALKKLGLLIAEINEILEELRVKLPRLRDFYQTSTIPMRVTGRLFTENEIKTLPKEEIVEIKEDKEENKK